MMETNITTGVTLRGDDNSMMHIVGNSRITVESKTDAKMVLDTNTALVLTEDIDFTMMKKTDLFGQFEVQPSAKVDINAYLYLTPQKLAMDALTIGSSGSITVATETSSEICIINATAITFNGAFTAGIVMLDSVHRFTVGNNVLVTFEPSSHDLVFGSIVDIRGNVTLRKTISFRRPFCEHLTINGGSLVMVGGENMTLECKEVTINGLLSIESPVNTGSGFDSFIVGSLGDFNFTPDGDFICDRIMVDGKFNSMTNIIMHGRIKENIQRFDISSAGRLTLDSMNQNNSMFTSTSVVAAQIVKIDGTFLPGQLHIPHVGNQGGWDSLEIGAQGRMQFQPDGDFWCNYIKVNGMLESYTHITVQGHSAKLQVIIGSGGSILFDSNSSHPLGPWSGQSSVSASTLNIATSSVMKAGYISLTGDDIDVNGNLTFEASSAMFTDSFIVGSNGHVEVANSVIMKGVSQIRTKTIKVAGYMEFDTRGGSDIHGVLNESSVVAAQVVKIDGTFLPGQLQISHVGNQGGWDSLEIGAQGRMQFQPDGNFWCNYIDVNGMLESYTHITVQGHSAKLEVIISSGGSILFDSNSSHPLGPWSGQSAMKEASKLNIATNCVMKAGYFNLTVEDIVVNGQLTFEASSVVFTDSVIVGSDGHVEVTNSIIMKGVTANRTKTITVIGYMELDTRGQNNTHDMLTSTSIVAAQVVKIDGTFLPGQLQISDVGNQGGWDSLEIGAQGRMQFQPDGDFWCNYIKVNGMLESYTHITVQGHSAKLEVIIGSGGSILFDSTSRHPLGPWSGQSSVSASTLNIATSSVMKAAYISLTVDDIDVNGNLTFEASSVVFTDSFIVGSKGHVEVANSVIMKGVSQIRTKTIKVAGYMEFDTRGGSDIHGALNESSVVSAQVVKIDGTFLPGQLQISHVGNQGGWDSLEIGAQGRMQFQPDGNFWCNYIDVNGMLESYTHITVHGHSAQLQVIIGSGGSILFDSNSSHPLGPWSGQSAMKEASKLNIARSSVMKAGYINLTVEDIVVNGQLTFEASSVVFTDSVVVGSDGHVEVANPVIMKGVTGNRTKTITVTGYMEFDTRGGSDIHGVLNESSVVAAQVVKIDGTFLPGLLEIPLMGNQSGWDSLEIGAHGRMQFQPDSDFWCNYIKVNGMLESYTHIIVQGHSAQLEVIIGSGGSILFDSNSSHPLGPWSGQSAMKEASKLNIATNCVMKAGYINLTVEDIVVNGHLTFEASSVVFTDSVAVGSNGRIEVANPVIMKGVTANRTKTITVIGYVEFDTRGGSDIHGVLIESSVVAAQVVEIDGTFLPGQFHIPHVGNQGGWDSLEIGAQGRMQFQPDGDFWCNRIKVNGMLESYTHITVQGHSAQLEVIIGSGGSILFDSNSSHPLGPWSGQSAMKEASKLNIATNCVMKAGYINLTVEDIVVNGHLTFEASSVVFTDSVAVGSNGRIEVANPVIMKGVTTNRTRTITVIGYVEFDTRGGSDIHGVLIESSVVDAQVVKIDGTFLPGQFHISHVGNQGGWDSLEIGAQGRMQFQPDGDFWCNYIKVNGMLESYTHITVQGHSAKLEVIIGSGGNILFDSNSSHPLGPWSGQSAMKEASKLNIARSSVMKAGYINLTVEDIDVNGQLTFEASSVVFTDSVVVGSNGRIEVANPVIMKGVTANRTKTITVTGYMEFDTRGGSDIHGVLIESSVVAAQIVKIDGTFLPALLEIPLVGNQSGWDSLEIGAQGRMQFQPDSDFWCNYIEVNGMLESYTHIIVQGHSAQLEVIIDSGGSILFDSNSSHPLGPWSGQSAMKEASKLNIATNCVMKAGYINLTVEDIVVNGHLTFEASSVVFTDSVAVGSNGRIEVANPVIMKGVTANRTRTITVSGYMEFDTRGGSDIDGVLIDSSIVAAQVVKIDGTFLPALLEIPLVGNQSGWDSLEIGAQGRMQFQPDGDFWCNYIKVNGMLESYTHITVQGHSAQLEVIVGSGGSIFFDSRSNHPLGPWSGQSAVKEASKLNIATNCVMKAGYINLTIEDIVVNGLLTFEASSVAFIDSFVVGSNGHVEVANPVIMKGVTANRTRTITVTGYMEFDTRGGSDIHGVLNESSVVAARVVKIDGTFLPGFLQISHVGNQSGWDSLEIGIRGRMQFQPDGDFWCNYIKVNGMLKSYTHITVLGHSAQLEVIIGSGGSVIFDSRSNHPHGPWSGQSAMKEASVLITAKSSEMKAGYISLTVDDIDVNGQLTFEASSVVFTDAFLVRQYGHVETANAVIVKNVTASRTRHITVNGYMKLDTRGNHDTREWSSSHASVLHVSSCAVGVGARFFAGYLSLADFVDTLTVATNGRLEFQPSTTFYINSTKIAGDVKSYTPMAVGTHLKGERLNVESTGTLDMDYNGAVNDSDSGCLPSYILMLTCDIAGTVQSGSLSVDTGDISVTSTGKMIVNYGGYESGRGQGKNTSVTQKYYYRTEVETVTIKLIYLVNGVMIIFKCINWYLHAGQS